MPRITLADAILKINSSAKYVVRGEDIEWLEGTSPIAFEDIKVKQTEMQSEQNIIDARVALYGTSEEQLEYIVENGVDAFIAKQNQIKTENPK